MKKAIIILATALFSVSALAQPKFAHVNLSELIQLMPEADVARTTLEASSTEAQETFQAMVEEYQAKYTTYSQKASSWTPAIRESKEKELMEIQQRIQEFEQSIQKELAEQRKALTIAVRDKYDALTADEIARLCPPSRLVETEKGCTEIFDITYGI